MAITSKTLISEKEKTKKLLDGFNPKGSRGEILVHKLLPVERASQNLLISVAQIISSLIGKKLKRDYKRKKTLLIKWFDDNYDIINTLIAQNGLKAFPYTLKESNVLIFHLSKIQNQKTNSALIQNEILHNTSTTDNNAIDITSVKNNFENDDTIRFNTSYCENQMSLAHFGVPTF